MLANDLAQAVADGATALAVTIGGLGELLGLRSRLRLPSEGTDLLDGADADSVGLPQRAIDSPSFGYTHFGAVDQWRDVGRIGVTIAHESLRMFCLVYRSPESPATCGRIAEVLRGRHTNANTAFSSCKA
jgi:hypothetical protein